MGAVMWWACRLCGEVYNGDPFPLCVPCNEQAADTDRQYALRKGPLPADGQTGTHRRHHGVIQTYSGRLVEPLALDPNDYNVLDCAHHLANLCRFTGAVWHFYGVAEHSVRASWLVRDWGGSPVSQFRALHHDDTEYVLNDVSRPLKKTPSFAEYREAEDTAEAAVIRHYDLGLSDFKADPLVKKADQVMLAIEARDLMGDPGWEGWPDPEGAPIIPMLPFQARAMYLQRHNSLCGQLGLDQYMVDINTMEEIWRQVHQCGHGPMPNYVAEFLREQHKATIRDKNGFR